MATRLSPKCKFCGQRADYSLVQDGIITKHFCFKCFEQHMPEESSPIPKEEALEILRKQRRGHSHKVPNQ